MASADAAPRADYPQSTVDRRPERVTTETKASFKTTELVF